jgi:hypothetical protein
MNSYWISLLEKKIPKKFGNFKEDVTRKLFLYNKLN